MNTTRSNSNKPTQTRLCQTALGTENATVANATDSSGDPICNQTAVTKGKLGGPNLKTFHMHRRIIDYDKIYEEYDPMTGIRTAVILGSFLFLVVLYVVYKANCRRRRWTSRDQLFIERYKMRKLTGDSDPNNKDLQTKGSIPKFDPCAMEATANWIQTQPLTTAVPERKSRRVQACNLCLQTLKYQACPLCTTSDIQTSTASSSTVDTTHHLFHYANEVDRDRFRSKLENLRMEVGKIHESYYQNNCNKPPLSTEDYNNVFKKNKWRSKSFDLKKYSPEAPSPNEILASKYRFRKNFQLDLKSRTDDGLLTAAPENGPFRAQLYSTPNSTGLGHPGCELGNRDCHSLSPGGAIDNGIPIVPVVQPSAQTLPAYPLLKAINFLNCDNCAEKNILHVEGIPMKELTGSTLHLGYPIPNDPLSFPVPIEPHHIKSLDLPRDLTNLPQAAIPINPLISITSPDYRDSTSSLLSEIPFADDVVTSPSTQCSDKTVTSL